MYFGQILPQNYLHVYHIINSSCRTLHILVYDIGRSLETLIKSQALGGNILHIRLKENKVVLSAVLLRNASASIRRKLPITALKT